jgi:hypothetical protein
MAPNPTDQHVGSRVRMRRKMLAMSQQKLAAALRRRIVMLVQDCRWCQTEKEKPWPPEAQGF